MSLAHELLLALVYVSQIADPGMARSKFFESVNGIDDRFAFTFAEFLPPHIPEERALPIATIGSSFGYAVMTECPGEAEAERAVFRNAFRFLAVIIENRAHARAMEMKNVSLLKEISLEKSMIRTVFDTLPVGVWVTDSEGTIVMGNDAGKRMWGGAPRFSEDRRGGRDADATGAEVTAGPEGWALARAIETGQTVMGEEIEIEVRDGSHRTILDSAAPLKDNEGRVIGGISVNQDITERKRAEEEKALLELQLIQSQKMEAIGTLAGGMAHDFNNILTVIIGFSNLIQMNLAPDDRNKPFVDQIVQSSQRAAELTRGLLAFSRKQRISLEPHEINGIVADAATLLGRLLTEEVTLKVEPGEEAIVMLDVAQIDQVLMNLATNARDAMPRGGILTIRTGVVRADDTLRLRGVDTPGMYARLSVSDTGVGMDERTMERIFDPFFTTKEVGKGTGLGLASVYGIVKQHGGYITVSSELLKGTTFDIYLPLEEPVPTAVPETPGQPAGGTETILVVEDEPSVRAMITTILSKQGYSVLEAGNGDEALRVFSEQAGAIKLVILDVVMPGKSGRETLDDLALMDPKVKAIFMSGYTGDVVIDKGVLEGEVPFLQKPLSVAKLLEKVREVLDR